MKKSFLTTLVIFALFSLTSSAFAGPPCPPDTNCHKAVPVFKNDSSVSKHELYIKEISVVNNVAQIHFQPGPIKYVAENGEKKTTMLPKETSNAWAKETLKGCCSTLTGLQPIMPALMKSGLELQQKTI